MTSISSAHKTALAHSHLIKKIEKLAPRIGHTPLLPIEGLHNNKAVKIFAKVEWKQLSGSVKARAAFSIIRQAVQSGQLDRHKILLDATSGNTGIAYAAISREIGLKVALCLPENASIERKEILQSLGAEIIYTSPFGGTDEAQEKAAELAQVYPEKYFYGRQYSNPENWKAHYSGTANEIIQQVQKITHFVTGLGTSGTFVGTTRRLKEWNSRVRAISLQPDVPLHGLEGWKHMETAVVPKIYDPNLADENRTVQTEEAFAIIRLYARKGILLSPSSAANIAGAVELANQLREGTIVTVLPDNGDKYSEIIQKII